MPSTSLRWGPVQHWAHSLSKPCHENPWKCLSWILHIILKPKAVVFDQANLFHLTPESLLLLNDRTLHIEDIQFFFMNMIFISSSEVKKYIFHEWHNIFSLHFTRVGGGAVRRYCVAFSAGASYCLGFSRARACCACSRCGMVAVLFFFYSILSFLSPCLWETARHDWNIVDWTVKPQIKNSLHKMK